MSETLKGPGSPGDPALESTRASHGDPALDATHAAAASHDDPALDATHAALALRGPTAMLEELPAAERYQITGEVGHGGIGRVLRARDRVLDRPVAVKELFVNDASAQRRFVREAQITARLQHPSIVPIYDAGHRGGRSPFYAMKLVSGRPLDRAIEQATTLAQRLALLPAVLAVADAIAYAHDHRIIHRDLKPANVLLGQFGETIVIDWGLAKDLASSDHDADDRGPYREPPRDATAAGALMGTPAYMAPEQAFGEAVDERADVYALGAMLYHVVSGTGPHEGTTLADMIERVATGKIRPLADREPGAPRDLTAIVTKAMALAPAARYPTARELAEDLRRFQAGQLVGAHRYTLAQRIRRWLARHRAIATVIAIAATILLGFGGWSLRQIVAERDAAIAQANRARLTQARATLEADPPEALALLAKLNVDGPGWVAARSMAAGARVYPRLERTLDHLPNPAFEITPDGRFAISADVRRIWIGELATGQNRVLPVRVTEPTAALPAVWACHDSQHALAVFGAAEIQVIAVNLTTGATTERVVDHTAKRREIAACVDPITAPATAAGAWLAPDGAHVVVLDGKGALHRLERDGRELGVIAGDTVESPGTADAWMSRDAEVVVTSVRGVATYWDFARPAHFVAHDAITHSVAVAPDGSHVWGVGRDWRWSITRGQSNAFRDDDVPEGALEVSPDGAWLISVRDDDSLVVLEPAAWTSITLRGVVQARVLAGNRLITSGRDGRLRVWRLERRARPHDHALPGVALSPRGAQLLTVNDDELRRGDPIDRSRVERAPGLALAHRGAIAVNDAGDAALSFGARVFAWPRGAAPRELGAHPGAGDGPLGVTVRSDGAPISWSPGAVVVWTPSPRITAIPASKLRFDGRLVVDDAGSHLLVGCAPEGIERRCLVEAATGRLDVLAGSAGDAGALSGDGTRVLTAGEGGGYLLWDVATRTSRPIALDRDSKLAALSRDGTHAVLGSPSDAELLDVERGTAISLRGHVITGPIVFSPDDRTFLDSSGTLVDVESGEARPGLTGKFLDFTVRNDAAVFATRDGITVLLDDLPRDPRGLAKRLTID
ncbi:MAG TPA: WD40 repeat domain-containing serine/threonine protein kinase [Kofleriaceae bacterium]|nr:WD40 repeat domain-containing serine/threonine protein kinase [Kofleriaceae bacterium]